MTPFADASAALATWLDKEEQEKAKPNPNPITLLTASVAIPAYRRRLSGEGED